MLSDIFPSFLQIILLISNITFPNQAHYDYDSQEFDEETYDFVLYSDFIFKKCSDEFVKKPIINSEDLGYLGKVNIVLSETIADLYGEGVENKIYWKAYARASWTPCGVLESLVGTPAFLTWPERAASTARSLNRTLGGGFIPNPYLSDLENRWDEMKWLGLSISIAKTCGHPFSDSNPSLPELFEEIVRRQPELVQSDYDRETLFKLMRGDFYRPGCGDWSVLQLRKGEIGARRLARELGIAVPSEP